MARMISTPDACDLIGVRHPTLYEARKAGKLTAFFWDDLEEAVPAEGGGKGYAVRWDYDQVVRFGRTLNQPPAPPLERKWLERAKCRNIGPVESNRIFFPEDYKRRGVWDEGRKMCFACPVRLDCLRWAVKVGVEDGMFGGSTPSQIRRFGVAWRRDRSQAVFCGWCGGAFVPLKGERYCRQTCGVAGEKAGGLDAKNRRSA